MERKKVRQRFFMAKELQISIAIIVLWSLLAGILFTYITKEVGARIGHNIFSFIAVFIGYLIIVIVFALFFTHRFIGPFERLKMELKLILAGNYGRRLCIRSNDDFYIRSFISEVNRLLDVFERKCFDKENFRKNIDTELLHMLALMEKGEFNKDRFKEAILSFHDKVESLLGNRE